MKSGAGRIMIDGHRVDIKGTSGNVPSLLGIDFTKRVFSGSFVGIDFIDNAVSGIVGTIVNTVVDAVL
ncbi:MAG: hypothetical protein EBT80_10495 [Chitinophagales bacterium]|nr:hypothetical protein [Chitinophagales bacterium]